MTSLNNKVISVENKLNILDKSIDAKLVYIQGQNRTITKGFTDKITIIENKIKEMEESLKELERKYEENKVILNKLEPKVGEKRKWWQVI